MPPGVRARTGSSGFCSQTPTCATPRIPSGVRSPWPSGARRGCVGASPDRDRRGRGAGDPAGCRCADPLLRGARPARALAAQPGRDRRRRVHPRLACRLRAGRRARGDAPPARGRPDARGPAQGGGDAAGARGLGGPGSRPDVRRRTGDAPRVAQEHLRGTGRLRRRRGGPRVRRRRLLPRARGRDRARPASGRRSRSCPPAHRAGCLERAVPDAPAGLGALPCGRAWAFDPLAAQLARPASGRDRLARPALRARPAVSPRAPLSAGVRPGPERSIGCPRLGPPICTPRTTPSPTAVRWPRSARTPSSSACLRGAAISALCGHSWVRATGLRVRSRSGL